MRLHWRKGTTTGLALLIATGLTACTSATQAPAGPVSLGFFSNPDESGATQMAVDRCNRQAGGRYAINYQVLPQSSDAQHEQLTRRLTRDDTDIDLMALDVNWTAEFAEAGWIEEIAGDTRTRIEDSTMSAALASASYEDKLYAAPLNSNTQLLWYRKDLVPTPPTTWDELLQQSAVLEAAGQPHEVAVQGAKYEGLTVWFNSLVASNGGAILTADGSRAETGAATRRAAEIMKTVATSTAADPALPNAQEDQARLAFERGSAAFQVNYPFVYSRAQNVEGIKDNIGFAPWPRVDATEPAEVTVGGINLAISTASRHKDLAMEAIDCLRSDENQITLATMGGLPPVNGALYDNEEVRSSYPMADQIRAALTSGSTRPSTPAYTEVSNAIQTVLSPPAEIDLDTVNDDLQSGIDAALRSAQD